MTSASISEPGDWVEKYGDALYRYAVSRLRDATAAEEVVQQTFVAGLEHQSQFAGKGTHQGWLMGILKRKIIDFIRDQRRMASSESVDPSDSLNLYFDERGRWKKSMRETLLQPLDSIDRAEFWPIFQKCLAGLPEKQSGVFALREMEELNSAEICKELNITPSNLWVLLHRARIRLARCIKLRWLQEKE